MSAAGKHAESADPGNSFSAATFRKALKGFEFGGLAYSEVQIELKRLLAGASRRELREVLRRSKSIEPLPEYAYREVRRLFDETIEEDVASETDPGDAREQEEGLDRAALTAELQKSREALESERTRVREAEDALSERIVGEEAARSRLGITLRELEHIQAELRAARNSIASRDKLAAQIRLTLDERDAQLAAIRLEHAELAAALDLRSASGEQLNADLQALRGQAADAATELAASREAIDQERRKRQEIERALTESNSLSNAARASLASRDKALAEMRQTLDERDAQLAAMRREHTELSVALDLHSSSGEQLDADLQVLRGQAVDAATELAVSREVVDQERRKRQEIERALTESNSLNSVVRASLASKDKALSEMRQTLDERDAQLAAMRREHAELAAALDSRSTSGEQLIAELHALRAQAAAAAADLAASRDSADKERRKRQEIERAFDESKVETQRELRAALRASEEKLRAAQGRVEKLSASVRSEAERAAQWQAAAQQRESAVTVTSAPVEAMPQVEVLPQAQAAQASASRAKLLAAIRGWHRNIRATPRQIWIGAAIVLLATVVWFAAHRPSPMPNIPTASSAAVIQPAATALATASVESEPVSTENVSAIETPPHAAATPAVGKAVTATAKLNTDFRSCRAGGIDACYDAVRYRPSDPSLLSALGDALLRANRPADALRAYQRVAILAPNMPGVVAKITAIEAKLSTKRTSGGRSTHATDVTRNLNAAPQTQSH
jgi:chromosome segregation ATPase